MFFGLHFRSKQYMLNIQFYFQIYLKKMELLYFFVTTGFLGILEDCISNKRTEFLFEKGHSAYHKY